MYGIQFHFCIGYNFTLDIARHIINYPKLEIYSLTLSTLEDLIILTEFEKFPFFSFSVATVL
jgi:hypothetical protein